MLFEIRKLEYEYFGGKMLTQALSFVMTLLVGLLGWYAKRLQEDVRTVERTCSDLALRMALDFVSKSDLDRRLDLMIEQLRRIEDKLDNKADK